MIEGEERASEPEFLVFSGCALEDRRSGFDEGLELPYGDQVLGSVFLRDDIDYMLAASHAIADGDLGTML